MQGKTTKKVPKITSRTGSHFCQVPNLQSELSEPFELTLIESGFNMIENLLCLGFISLYLWFCYALSLKAFVIYARHFEYSGMRCFVICLKTTGVAINRRLNLRKRLLTIAISKINIVR